jgi:hypothetical protein
MLLVVCFCRLCWAHTAALMFLVSLSGRLVLCCLLSYMDTGCCWKILTVHQWMLCLFLFPFLRLEHCQCRVMETKSTLLQILGCLLPGGTDFFLWCIIISFCLLIHTLCVSGEVRSLQGSNSHPAL